MAPDFVRFKSKLFNLLITKILWVKYSEIALFLYFFMSACNYGSTQNYSTGFVSSSLWQKQSLSHFKWWKFCIFTAIINLFSNSPPFFPFLIVRDDGPDQIKKQKDKQNKNKSMKWGNTATEKYKKWPW